MFTFMLEPGPYVFRELQNRFARLNAGQSQSQDQPAEGTTWAQKQAALKTASNLNKDPSSVSASDAKSAVGTALARLRIGLICALYLQIPQPRP